MSFQLTVGGVNYTIPSVNDAASTNWGQNLGAFFTALAANIATSPAFMQTVTVTTTPQAVLSTKTYLVNSASLAITLNLPVAAVNAWFIVKDIGYNAATNNITIHRAASESIENVASDFILAQNGGSWTFVSDGTNWFAITSTGAWQ